MIRRREFITLLGGVAALPYAARAQKAGMPVLGYLELGSPDIDPGRVAAFRKGLSEAGYIEGRNLAIEFRFAHNDNKRLPELAADLVRHRVTAMFAPSGTQTALAAKAATSTIPIIFHVAGDPVQSGLVTSLNRPGGNVTGVANMTLEAGSKRLGLLRELLPKAEHFAVLANPTGTIAQPTVDDLRTAAARLGLQIDVFPATTISEIDTAFAMLVQKQADAVLVSPQVLFINRRVQLVTLAARYLLPTMYWEREFVEYGGLMSYGASMADQVRQAGIYTGRVLNGEKPADLPILQPTKFDLVINLQTARLLKIEVPPTLLAQADEVID
jgi:putative ABC transport system substrate-binding protein